MTPAAILRRLRTDAGLTQRDLATAVGCSLSHAQKAERDSYGSASLDYLLRVAEACGAVVLVESGPRPNRKTVAVRLARAGRP